MKKTVLRKYARLIARTGVNVQKGQDVLITAELDQPEFVRILTEECYRAGAARVIVDWTDSALTKLHFRHRTQKVLNQLLPFEVEKWKYMADTLPCRIYLDSDDPDALAGINQKKMALSQQAKMKVIKPFRDQMENRYQWCIAAVPGAAWAKKLFPELKKSAAMERLWEAILSAARADGEDPTADWAEHNRELAKRCQYLNGLGIKELHYTASNGTDFRVGMMPEGIFMAGGEETQGRGVYYNPNIPTEEAFATPKRGEAEGIVYASMPLSYNGQLIENFWIRFHEGKAVEVYAEKNQPLLEEMISMDEGAAYLGEVALVPYESPIRRSGILFYSTLFDENAACHLALGRGFSNCLKDYEKYSHEEAQALGVNDSIIHVDFMIGTADLNITALTFDGKEVPIFKNGTWAN